MKVLMHRKKHMISCSEAGAIKSAALLIIGKDRTARAIKRRREMLAMGLRIYISYNLVIIFMTYNFYDVPTTKVNLSLNNTTKTINYYN